MGVGQARNRTRRAVERTAPFGLVGFSVVSLSPPTAPTAWAYAFAFLDVPAVDVESHQGQSITRDLM
jgi:hypothetical protein